MLISLALAVCASENVVLSRLQRKILPLPILYLHMELHVKLTKRVKGLCITATTSDGSQISS